MLRLFRLLAVTGLLVLGTAPGMAQSPAIVPGHVGSQTCSSCHESEGQGWQGSHHAWAWTQPDETTILGDFDDAVFEHKGVTTHFTRHDGSFSVETEGSDGALHTFQVVGVVGVAPLQQYLVATQAGRLQALDIVWDVEDKRWYHLYPDQNLPPGDGLHWTGPYKNWNARCAECHAAGFVKNYDPGTRSYMSNQAEIGVGCEACHGPAEAHIAWARSPASFDAYQWAGVGSRGLTVPFDAGDAEVEIQLCAGCHSRREPLGASSPEPGSPYADSYRLALLREGLYHPDGQILDEVYVYGPFLQSKMYAKGVRCTDCHEPHSARLRADGNAVCTQCHNPEGNGNFPSLTKALYDGRNHHFHEAGSEGAQCVSCHMPERLYMVIDGRRDHSFRVPRPDLSLSIGTPNACMHCHEDKDNSWAAEQVATWYPSGRSGASHYGEIIVAARSGIDDETRALLLALAKNIYAPAIVRATALALLRSVENPEIADAVAPLLGDGDAIVRTAAVALQRSALPPVRMQRLLGPLTDPMRSVRIEAARALLDIPAARIPPAIAPKVRAAMGEYQDSLIAKADFPEGQMAIAGTALTLRNFVVAESAFSEAVAMDPQLADGWLMIARLEAAKADLAAAETTLRHAVEVLPNSGALHHSLGGILLMAGREEAAIAPLEEAVRLMPGDPAALTDLGALLSRIGAHGRAVLILNRAKTHGGASPEIFHNLVASHLALGDRQAAEVNLLMLEVLFPDSPHLREASRLMGR